MNPNDIPEAGWVLQFLVGAAGWLNTVVYLVGLAIAVWAFLRCRKCGYLVIAAYFALTLLVPTINWLRVHRPPDASEQMQQKIDAAVQEAIDKVLVEEGHPEGIARTHKIRISFSSILLVVGLWLVARHEPRRPDKSLQEASQ
jgi:hypothetical protein